MKTNTLFYALLALFLAFSSVGRAQPDWLWAKSVGAITPSVIPGNVDCGADVDGNVYVVSGKLEKYDLNGAQVWSVQDVGGRAISVDVSGKLFVTGTRQALCPGAGSSYVAKYGDDGTSIWTKCLIGMGAGAFARTRGVSHDKLGNVWVIGEFTGTIAAQPGNKTVTTTLGTLNIFVAKYDPDGNILFLKQYGLDGGIFERAGDIVVNSEGAAFITGSFGAAIDFDGINLIAGSVQDVFIAKLDDGGQTVWAKRGGSPSAALGQGGSALALDLAGNVFVAGNFSGTATINGANLSTDGPTDRGCFLVKMTNTDGNVLWGQIINGPKADTIRSIATDVQNNVYVTGSFIGKIFVGGNGFTPIELDAESDKAIEVYVAKLDGATGQPLFGRRTKGEINENDPDSPFDANYGDGIAVLATKEIYVSGGQKRKLRFRDIDVNGNENENRAFVSKMGLSPQAPTIVTNSPICNGGSLTLTAQGAPPGGVNYLWTGPNNFSSTLPSPIISPVSPINAGEYSLKLTVNGSGLPTVTTTVQVISIDAQITALDNGCTSFILKAAPSGAGFGFRWFINGQVIDGATDSVYVATVSGKYTVRVNTPEGCVDGSPEKTITVTPAPTLTASAADTVVCAGETLTLMADGPAGGFYRWTGPGDFLSLDSTAVIPAASPNNSGTYSVTVTVAGCTSEVKTVTVIVKAPTLFNVPTTNSPVCEGKTLILSANVVAGAHYEWKGPNNIVSLLPVVTLPNAVAEYAGNWTLIVTKDDGCFTDTFQVEVTMLGPNSPSPVQIESNSPVCVDGTLKLKTVPQPTGATYKWAGPNNFASVFPAPQIPDVTTLRAGTYSVTVTLAGCTAAPAVADIDILVPPDKPEVDSDTICAGTNVSLSVKSPNAEIEYRWYDDVFSVNPFFTGTNFVTPTLTQTVSYFVEASIGDCKSARTPVTVTVGAPPTLTLVKTDATSPGNGSITATATGGFPPYSFALNGGTSQASGEFTGLDAGLYSVIVKDPTGCQDRDTIRIELNCTFSLTADLVETNCTGKVTLTANGGTAPYTYSIDGLSFHGSNVFDLLPAGSYIFMAKDKNGCIATVSGTVTADRLSTAKVGARWYFGKNAGLNFNTLPPAAVTNGAINTLEGCASICDNSGNLIFYTDGITVFNKNHAAMPLGFPLDGDPSAAQSAVIVPKPGSNTEYYIFTVPFRDNNAIGLKYSIVDMSLNAGLGDVPIKNVPLFQPSTERLAAVPHENGIDYWTLAHEWNSDAFYAYKTSATGLNLTPVVSNAGSPIVGTGTEDAIGTIKFNLTGKAFVLTQFFSGVVELFGFDKATGKVSPNPITLGPIPDAYGAEFSADGTKVYVSTLKNQGAQSFVYQFNLLANDIPASRQTIYNTDSQLGALQIGPDGKIYVAINDASALGVINRPNLAGAASNFVAVGPALGGKQSRLGLPNFIYDQLLPVNAVVKPLGTNALCGGNVTLQATPPGAASYAWFMNGTPIAGATSVTYNTTQPGSYSVKVTTTAGCASVSEAYVVTTVTALTLNALKTDVTTVNGTNGAILATATGGTPPYRFALNGATPQSAANFTGLTAGTYDVSVIDDNGCTTQIPVTIIGPQNCTFTVTSTVKQPACYGGTNGGATVKATPAGQYNYVWSNGGDTDGITGIGAGTYQCAVTDLTNNCTVTHTVVITQPEELRIYATPIDATSIGGSNGAVNCLLRGGILPLYMSLDTLGIPTTSAFGNNRAFGGLTPGYYTARAKDDNGCVDSVTVFVGPYTRPRNPVWVTDGTVYASSRSGNTTYVGGEFNWAGPYTGTAALTDTATSALKTFPATNGPVYAVVGDGAGGWFIGGEFSKVGTFTRNRLAHIKPDGTVDANWNPNPNATVHTLLLNSGVLYVGGAFTKLGNQTRNCLAALTASTGAVKNNWNPNVNETVYALSTSGTTLYLGGRFTKVGNQARNRLAAVQLSSGSVTGWNPNADDEVYALVATASNVFIGGKFSRLRGLPRLRLGVVSPGAGQVSTTFIPDPDAPVYALALFGNELYAGGAFTGIGGQNVSYLAALNGTSGTVSTTFTPQADGVVYALFRDGLRLYATGAFTQLGGAARRYAGAVSVDDGSATNWNPQPGDVPRAVYAFQGKAAFGGNFNSANVQTRNNIAAIDELTGKVTAWNPNANGTVRALVATESGTVVAGGAFTIVGGAIRSHIAELDSVTAQSTAFNPAPNNTVLTLLKYDDKIVLGGMFTQLGAQSRNYVAMVNGDGSLVTSWNPFALKEVYSLARWRNTIIVGGAFTGIGGAFRNYIASVSDFDGQATVWNPNADATVRSVMLSADYVYFGGDFQNVKGQARQHAAAVHAATENLENWRPNINGTVHSLSLRGRDVYVGGAFNKINGIKRYNAALVNDTSGAPKSSWSPAMNDVVYHTSVYDTSIYYGGSYSQVGSELRSGFVEFIDKNPCFITADFIGNDTIATITVKPTRGTADWRFSIDGGQTFGTDSIFTNLLPKTYSVVVQDANHCKATKSVKIKLLQCDTPIGITAINITDISATISWERVWGAASYRLQFRKFGTNTWGNVNVNDTAFTLVGLFPDTEYEYRVRANCIGGLQSTFSEKAGFITLPEFECTAPLDLTVTADTTFAQADWTPVTGATAYGVRYRKVGDAVFVESEVSAPPFTMTNLAPGEDYEFFIWSICVNGDLSPEVESGYTTLSADCPQVGAITVQTLTTTQATFSWALVPNAQLYIVEYRPVGAPNFTVTSTADAPLLLTGLTPATPYEIRVKAKCINGAEGLVSPTATFTTETEVIPVCDAPSGFTFTNLTDTKATVSWNAVSGVTQYEVSYKDVDETTFTVVVVNAPTVTLLPLDPGATYEVKVRSICPDGGFSAFSTKQVFSTLSFCTTPAGLTVIPATTTALAQWAAVVGAANYTLAFRVKGSGALWTNVAVGNVTAFTLTNLTPGVTYETRIRARCVSGSASAWTARVTFTTLSARESASPQAASVFPARVYPNPSGGVFYLDFDGAPDVKAVEVWDAAGRLVFRAPTPENALSIDLTDRASGVYLLKITTTETVYQSRIVKR